MKDNFIKPEVSETYKILSDINHAMLFKLFGYTGCMVENSLLERITNRLSELENTCKLYEKVEWELFSTPLKEDYEILKETYIKYFGKG